MLFVNQGYHFNTAMEMIPRELVHRNCLFYRKGRENKYMEKVGNK